MESTKNIKCFEEYHVMKYRRTVPRDFFNEAKLLKCMGVLSLRILDGKLPPGIDIKMAEPGTGFKIDLLSDGSLTVSNYPVTINGQVVTMKTIYNTKANFPLVCELDYEETTVFDDNGDWDEEFVARFRFNELDNLDTL